MHTQLLRNYSSSNLRGGYLGRSKSYIAVYKNEAKWISKPRYETTTVFNANSFSKCVEFLIKNAYFEIGDRVMQQIIGIPMGTDPGPFMANAHLYKYEFDFKQI